MRTKLRVTHLKRLESEAVYITREVVTRFGNLWCIPSPIKHIYRKNQYISSRDMPRSLFYMQCRLIVRVSRAKEQTFYFRDKNHRWNPRSQRPELWDFYNTRINKGESIHVLPPSSLSGLSFVWSYIYQESFEIVPLYLTKEHTAAERIGTRIIMNHDRTLLNESNVVQNERVKFRTLACYP